MKDRFKKGDIVVALTNHYGVTSVDNNWKGIVVEYGSGKNPHYMYVKTTEAKDIADLNDNTMLVNSKHFALAKRKLQVFPDEVVSSPKKGKKRRSKYKTIGSGTSLLSIAKSFKLKVHKKESVKREKKMSDEMELAVAWAKNEITITQVALAIGYKRADAKSYSWLLNTFKNHFIK